MNEKQKVLGYYNYTVILTYLGMLAGFVGVFYAIDGRPYRAVVCLMVAGCCDMFDGPIASTMKRTQEEKHFGIQIDSMSDLICFGVLPAVILYCMNAHNNIVVLVSCFYLLCALIRLSYFNVDELKRQEITEERRTRYLGLPVTVASMLLPFVYALCRFFSWKMSDLPAVTLAAMAVLFLLPIPIRKPKTLGKILVLLWGVLEFVLVLLSSTGA